MHSAGPVLCVLIDAFRHDYLTAERAPNLARMAREGVGVALRPILGYSDAIRAVIFTGRYPDEHGYWMEYCFRPGESPWRGLDRLGVLDQVPSDFALRAMKFAASTTVMRVLARRRGVPHLDLRHIPFRGVACLGLTLDRPMTAPGALGVPTIFDHCASSGRSWAYLDSSKAGRGSLLRRIEHLPDDVGLIFVYLHQVDMAAHLRGIEAKRFWRCVRRTDTFVQQLVDRVHARFPATPPLIFSDHGMSVIREQVGLPELGRHPGFPSDFFFALDATMVRLWYRNDDANLRLELRQLVERRLPGRFLTERDRMDLHLRFTNRLYGDDIFLVTPGTAVFPNFHSYIKPKAMHAYHPDDRDQLGIFIGPAAARDRVRNPMSMVEIAPLCLELMGVRGDGEVGAAPSAGA
jgi:hypothetical protein